MFCCWKTDWDEYVYRHGRRRKTNLSFPNFQRFMNCVYERLLNRHGTIDMVWPKVSTIYTCGFTANMDAPDIQRWINPFITKLLFLTLFYHNERKWNRRDTLTQPNQFPTRQQYNEWYLSRVTFLVWSRLPNSGPLVYTLIYMYIRQYNSLLCIFILNF